MRSRSAPTIDTVLTRLRGIVEAELGLLPSERDDTPFRLEERLAERERTVRSLEKSVTKGDADSEAVQRRKGTDSGPESSLTGRPASPMDEVIAPWKDCRRCPLCEKRTTIVFGAGRVPAPLMLIGEGPGAEEDARGLPFVGRSGMLLTRMLESIDIERETVYITNIVKCRPPGNRNPEPDEVEACRELLEAQIDVVSPKVIMTLGACAIRALLPNLSAGITRLRGQLLLYNGTKVVPTFHPAYLLRNPSAKKEAWKDLKLVRRLLQGGNA